MSDRVEEKERVDAMVEALIEKFDWVICGADASMDGEVPVHAHTMGLNRLGMPELIVVGLPHPIGGGILNALAIEHLAKEGGTAAGLPGPIAVESVVRKLYLVPVAPEELSRYAPAVFRRSGPSAYALQVCWADNSGLFPWDHRFDGGQWEQPVLGSAPVPVQ